METKDLESKVWFRFLKVVFVFVYIATVLAVLAVAYASKPYSTTDNDNSVIVCSNSTIYKAGDNGIDAVQALAEQLGGWAVGNAPWEAGAGATPEKDKATNLCLLGYPPNFKNALTYSQKNPNSDFADELRKRIESGQLNDIARQEGYDLSKMNIAGAPQISSSTNPIYKVELVNKTVGSWWSFTGYTVLALLIVVIIFELIKRSFLYVAIGKKFFSRQRKT